MFEKSWGRYYSTFSTLSNDKKYFIWKTIIYLLADCADSVYTQRKKVHLLSLALLELSPVSGLSAVPANCSARIKLPEAGRISPGGLAAPDGAALAVHVGAAPVEAVTLQRSKVFGSGFHCI